MIHGRRSVAFAVAVVLVVGSRPMSSAWADDVKGPGSKPIALFDLRNSVSKIQRDGIVQAMATAASWYTPPSVMDSDEPLRAAMAQAQAAYANVQCTDVSVAASTAALLASAAFAHKQRSGEHVVVATRYLLLCADQTGAVDDAMMFAERLRRVRWWTSTTATLDPSETTLLARYPSIDAATDHEVRAITVKGHDSNGSLWIDYQRVNPTQPMYVADGRHVVISVVTDRAIALDVVVDRRNSEIVIPTSASQPVLLASGFDHDVANDLDRWRNGAATIAQRQRVVAAVAASLHAHRILVFDGASSTLWTALDPQLGQPSDPLTFTQVGGPRVRTISELSQLAAGGATGVGASGFKNRAPDPNIPLLLDNDDSGNDVRRDKTAWWIYASVIGTLAAGAVIIYAHDAGKDTQRISVRWQ
jgi:hypothetical protein